VGGRQRCVRCVVHVVLAEGRPSPRPASWWVRASRYQSTGLCPEEPRRGCAPDPRRARRPATLRPRRGARRAGEREVESSNGQLAGPSIPLPTTGALPRRAPPGLRPGPATQEAARNAASVAWCASCWRAGGRARERSAVASVFPPPDL